MASGCVICADALLLAVAVSIRTGPAHLHAGAVQGLWREDSDCVAAAVAGVGRRTVPLPARENRAVPRSYFFSENLRSLAVPSLAMNLYNKFFAHHPLKRLCQICLLKPITG